MSVARVRSRNLHANAPAARPRRPRGQRDRAAGAARLGGDDVVARANGQSAPAEHASWS